MAIQEKFPSIRPSLNLDFANTKTLDPRITFSRASTATYYDGKTVAKAEENLLLNSKAPLGLGWYSIGGRTGATGAEVLVNGDFSNGLEGWSQLTTGVLSIESEKIRIEGTGTSNFHGVRYALAIPSGTYQIQLDASIFAGSGVVKGFTGATGGTELFIFGLKSGLNTFSITTSSSFYLWIQANNSISFSALIDNVSVKPLYADNKISPDGMATAATFLAVSDNAALYQAIAAKAGDYTFSVWLRRVTGSGNVDIRAGSQDEWVTQTLTESWARFTVTRTLTAGSRTPGIRLTAEGDIIEVWGAQLEQRSSVTAYTPTTTQPITNYVPVLRTAAANVARFDHNPVTGESLGLLIEEQRTNLLRWSQEFDNASWNKTRSGIAANSIVAPDGTLTADKLVEDTSTGDHQVFQSTTFSFDVNHAFSCYAKAAERTRIRLHWNATSGALIADVDLLTGSVLAGTNVTVRNAGNGWWRIEKVMQRASGNALCITLLDGTGAVSYTGDGYSGIYIWGAQLEAGAFATSYIPTTTSQVTRSADHAVMTGSNFSSWYRQDEGSFVAKFSVNNAVTSASKTILNVNDGSENNRIWLRISQTVVDFVVSAVGQGQVDTPGFNYVSSGLTATVSIAYKKDDFVCAMDPFSPQTDTSGLVPVCDRLNIGSRLTAGSETLHGHIRKIAYYPRRLTNTQLQALTT